MLLISVFAYVYASLCSFLFILIVIIDLCELLTVALRPLFGILIDSRLIAKAMARSIMLIHISKRKSFT